MRESGIYQMYLKNLLDRLLALVGTAALSWLLILLGIAIHLDSPGPIFFRQKRAGKNGTYYYIYKFRTIRNTCNRISINRRDCAAAARLPVTTV